MLVRALQLSEQVRIEQISIQFLGHLPSPCHFGRFPKYPSMGDCNTMKYNGPALRWTKVSPFQQTSRASENPKLRLFQPSA